MRVDLFRGKWKLIFKMISSNLLILARKLYLNGEYRECLRKVDELTARARRDNSNVVQYCKRLGKLARGFLGGPNQS